MNWVTMQQIITEDLGMRKNSAKVVPRILTDDQKQRRLHILSALLQNAEMVDKVITSDETWCFQYDPETKRQSMQWKTQNSPQPQKARMSRSQFKTMLLCFFDHKGIIHYDFIAQGQTANQLCYLEVLTRLRETVRRKRPEIWHDKWIHKNVPAHDALSVRNFLAKKSITKMDHPPHLPDLAPCDFWLFRKLENVLKGQRFADIPDIQRNVTTLLRCSGKRFSRQFPAVAPSSHEMHSFTRRVFRRRHSRKRTGIKLSQLVYFTHWTVANISV
jgi:histone-lysine N-methyltransferase SETMAR